MLAATIKTLMNNIRVSIKVEMNVPSSILVNYEHNQAKLQANRIVIHRSTWDVQLLILFVND